MRARLFLAFFAVMLTALISIFIFQRLILSDFRELMLGISEDRLYQVLATVEGSHTLHGWDQHSLAHSLQWGMVMGYDMTVLDMQGNTVMNTPDALNESTPTLQRRIESLVTPGSPSGPAEEFPLFVAGEEIGALLVRDLTYKRDLHLEKEIIFTQRGRKFLLVSFLLAGGGALALSTVLSLYLTRPIRSLKKAADAVASGDLNASVHHSYRGELGMLINSFNTMVESLRREESLRRHLTSNIAHELRTPLTIMKSNIEAVADGVVQMDSNTLGTLLDENQRLINLVRGIEDFTRAEASFFKPAQMETLGLAGFVESVVQSMAPVFAEKGIELQAVSSVNGVNGDTVTIDAEKTQKILRNLLSNALRHTHRGKVMVSSAIASDPPGLSISVSDTGRGISPEDLPRIFERFHKGSDSPGIGLGLAIARELTEIMGGAIQVRSTLNEGSTFTLSLPLARNRNRTGQAQQP